MRGKVRASTRFNKFREIMLLNFKDEGSNWSDFFAFLRNVEDEDKIISTYCDETETLHHLHSSPPTAIYQILRMIDRPVLLRELEVLGEHIWGEGKLGKYAVYTALSVLYSVNLIDYKFRDFISTPSNVIQFFVKEENILEENV